MAKEELFDSWFERFFVRAFGAFPVRKGGLDRAALKRASSVLSQGLVLGMFPEGARSRRAQLQRALRGAALIALRSGVPIVPVGISGTERLRGLGWFFTRPRITVQVGEPFVLPSPDSKPTRAFLGEATNLIMSRIAELLPPSYRGEYQSHDLGGKRTSPEEKAWRS